MNNGTGQFKGKRISVFGNLVKCNAARIRHTHCACRFVKRLACGIVTGSAENFHLCVVFHHNNMAVTSGHHKAQKRRF